MIEQATIDALKSNLAQFDEMEHRQAAEQIGKGHFEVLDRHGAWISQAEVLSAIFGLHSIYRLRADYELPDEDPYKYFSGSFNRHPFAHVRAVCVAYKYFEIRPRGNAYWVYDHRRNVWWVALMDLPGRVRFAGVQFEGQDDVNEWWMSVRAFIDPDGHLADFDDGCEEGRKPAVPVRVRMLKEV